jgi:hypothetical protein
MEYFRKKPADAELQKLQRECDLPQYPHRLKKPFYISTFLLDSHCEKVGPIGTCSSIFIYFSFWW